MAIKAMNTGLAAEKLAERRKAANALATVSGNSPESDPQENLSVPYADEETSPAFAALSIMSRSPYKVGLSEQETTDKDGKVSPIVGIANAVTSNR